MKQYQVHTIELKNGETIAYRKAGDRSDIILLVHGNMSSSVHYQIAMEDLEKDFTVYALDLRGFGDSSYKQAVSSLKDFSEDVVLFIEALDLKNVILTGWSTGGGVVLETAATLPERIKKVFLLDSVGIKGFVMNKKDASGQVIPNEYCLTKDDIQKDPVQVIPILMAYASRNKDLLKMIWNAVIYNLNQPNPEDYDRYLEAMLKQRNLVDVDYSLVHFNMTHEDSIAEKGSGRMDLIKCPIVIMHGTLDLVIPFAESEEMKKFLNEKATLIPLENVGHSCLTDNLNLFTQTLRDNIGSK